MIKVQTMSRIWISLVLLILITKPGQIIQVAGSEIDGRELSKILIDFTDTSLGASRLQAIIENTEFYEERLDPKAILERIEEQVSNRFNRTFHAVRKLQAALESEYINGSFNTLLDRDDNRQCCQVYDESIGYVQKYQKRVDRKNVCFRYAEQANSNSIVPISEYINKTMRDNGFDEDALKWQYYGTIEGVTVTYPRRRIADCSTFDPRITPWYVESATSLPKDIVVVLEHAGSSVDYLNLTKKAALTVIDTMNQDDRIGIIAFAGETETLVPGDLNRRCFEDTLAFATPDNKVYLRGWINHIPSANSQPEYTSALEKAFTFFRTAPVSSDPRPRRPPPPLVLPGPVV